MKIAAISSAWVPSVAANSIQVMKVCSALAELGHTVQLFTPETAAKTGWEELEVHYGLRTQFEITWLRENRAFKRYDFALHALNAARSFGAEIIYTWLYQAAALACWKGYPTLLEMHETPTGKLGPQLFRYCMRSNGKKRILPTTRAIVAMLEQVAGVKFAEEEVVVCPNGVELHRYENLPPAAEARQLLGLPQGLTVGFTGHFYAGRGVDLMMGLAEQFPGVRFLWAGGRAEDVERTWEQVHERGLHNVTLTGFVENQRLPLYQAAADILLMPYGKAIAGSSGGNIVQVINPMKMFEYLAAGRAILSADLPILHEVLNERNAVFAPPEDAEAWKAALAALIASEPRRAALGEQARRDAAQYTWLERERRALQGFV